MISKICIIIEIILSLPKTIIFNFRYLKFKEAIKLPIYIDNNIRVLGAYRGSIELRDNHSMFSIKFGIGGSDSIISKRGLLYLNKNGNGKIVFKGTAKFSKGTIIYNNTGKIVFGNNFICNKNCSFSCDNVINFGNDVLLGWEIRIRDSDGHKIIYKEKREKYSPINIGNHVWICSYSDILKNTCIKDNCVIGYRSLVVGLQSNHNELIAGSPAKIIKSNISWEK